MSVVVIMSVRVGVGQETEMGEDFMDLRKELLAESQYSLQADTNSSPQQDTRHSKCSKRLNLTIAHRIFGRGRFQRP